DAATLVSGGHHEQEFSVTTPTGAGIYWVEIRATDRLPAVPWITSNPIYVGTPESPPKAPIKAPAGSSRSLLGGGVSASNWRAEQPMRMSVQLRSDRGRWQRSLYVDAVNQDRTVSFDDLMPASFAESDKPPLAEIRSILMVVDSTNTKPGTSGRIWITQPRLE